MEKETFLKEYRCGFVRGMRLADQGCSKAIRKRGPAFELGVKHGIKIWTSEKITTQDLYVEMCETREWYKTTFNK